MGRLLEFLVRRRRRSTSSSSAPSPAGRRSRWRWARSKRPDHHHCDVDAETNAIARRYAEEAGVVDRIDYRVGPALETIESLDGPFDLIFIDADKENYVNYYEAVLPSSRTMA